MTRFLLAVLILTLGSACSGSAPRRADVAPPTIPALSEPVEAVSLPVPATLPAHREANPVGEAIVRSRLHFENGERAYDLEGLNAARDHFDQAMDVLLEASASQPSNSRISAEIKELVARIHALELAALREGDSDVPAEERAAVDDLRNVQTFPALIDPQLKEAVEEDVREVTHDLPIEINNRVLAFLEYYQNGRGRSTMAVGLERLARYRPMIERILREENAPLDLIYVAQAESAFLPRALSRAKAKGMWQFIAARGKEYGLRQNWWIDERSDPEKSTRAAARHLKDLYEEFGDWYLAMAGYNAGPARVRRAMQRSGATTFWQLADKGLLPRETINYVPTVLALAIIGTNPEKYGFNPAPQEPFETDRVSVDKPTDLRVIAESIAIPVEQLRELNPHVLRWTTPPDDPDFQLNLPTGMSAMFYEKMAAIPDSQRILWRDHVVQRGDTLSAIARRYNTTVTDITQANNISARKVLRIGEALLIPISGVSPSVAANAAAAPSAAASAAPASAAQPAVTTYTVRRGDTLSAIASRFGVTVANLRQWNSLPSTRINVGKKLRVASPVETQAAAPSTESRTVVHEVRRGDTLTKIATTYNTTVNAILSWNNRNDLSVIHPGDQITIFLGNED